MHVVLSFAQIKIKIERWGTQGNVKHVHTRYIEVKVEQ